MMKRLLIGLMLLMTAGAASAEWTQSGDNDEFITYVDRATIRRNGNFVKMWSLKDFKTVQKSAAYGYFYLSEKSQSEYDCKEEMSRMLPFTWFDGKMGNGKVVYSNNDSSRWIPIQPGSIGETLWKIACEKASAEWTLVGDNERFIQYVDLATIRRNGNLVKIWELNDFKTVQTYASDSYLSYKIQSEHDCKEEKSRFLAVTLSSGQMGSGKVVFTKGDVRGEWRPIAPGSSGEALWKIACGKK